MENIELSIIVPVYNVESYLRECLDSLVNQIPNLSEIIIVNDGSTDNSKEICEEYNKKYKNIILISQLNKGLGAARNEGIKHAKGKYIAFVDSDDYVRNDMYKTMLNVAQQENLDLVICGVEMYFENTNKRVIIEDNIISDKIITSKQLIKNIFERKIQCFAWNKIYKRELFENIKYEEGVYYEDIYTMYSIALKCNKSKIIKDPFYIYRQRNNNITSKVTLKHITDFNLAIEKVNNKFINEKFYTKNLMMAFNITSLNTSFDLYIKHKKFNNKEIYKDYESVYSRLPKYKMTEVMFNKLISFRYKKNYILFKMRILPAMKKIKKYKLS